MAKKKKASKRKASKKTTAKKKVAKRKTTAKPRNTKRIVKKTTAESGAFPDGNEGASTGLEGVVPDCPEMGRDSWNGWGPVFLESLRKHKGVEAACRESRVCRTTAYKARREVPAFKEAWIEAIELNVDELEQTALTRAINGWREPIVYRGEIVAVKRVYSAALTIFMLKKLRADVFGDRDEARGLDPAEVAAALVEFQRAARGTVGNANPAVDRMNGKSNGKARPKKSSK
jgi:hypothetical protein